SFFYSAICFFLVAGLFWSAGQLRPSEAMREILARPSYSDAIYALLLLFACLLLAATLGFLMFALYELIIGLAVTGRRKDEFAAFRQAWMSFKKHYRVDILVILPVGVLFDFLIRR